MLPPDAVSSPFRCRDLVNTNRAFEWSSVARIMVGVLAILVVDCHIALSWICVDVSILLCYDLEGLVHTNGQPHHQAESREHEESSDSLHLDRGPVGICPGLCVVEDCGAAFRYTKRQMIDWVAEGERLTKVEVAEEERLLWVGEVGCSYRYHCRAGRVSSQSRNRV